MFGDVICSFTLPELVTCFIGGWVGLCFTAVLLLCGMEGFIRPILFEERQDPQCSCLTFYMCMGGVFCSLKHLIYAHPSVPLSRFDFIRAQKDYPPARTALLPH